MSAVYMVRKLLLSFLLLLLAATFALAGSGYDACQLEKKRLQADEEQQCNGVNYIFNPSACFNTRKALAPYTREKCREIAVREGVQLNEEVKAAQPVSVAKDPVVCKESTPSATLPAGSKGVPYANDSRSEIELLKKELGVVKEELKSLKEEVSRLRQK